MRKRTGAWLGVLSEACGVEKIVVALGVKYLKEMEKQVKILGRDSKKQINFSVHCESLFSGYAANLSHRTILIMCISFFIPPFTFLSTTLL